MGEDNFYRKDWMTDDQWECAQMFAHLRGGFHHVGGEFQEFNRGVQINEPYGHWATYDFSDLTRLVVLSHDRMIRSEIRPSGPGRIKFILWKRHKREGRSYERHPTIEEAIIHIRGKS